MNVCYSCGGFPAEDEKKSPKNCIVVLTIRLLKYPIIIRWKKKESIY